MVLLGEPAARESFLPDLISGAKGCAIALSEPLHGSDLTHLETTAAIDGDDVVINGGEGLGHRVGRQPLFGSTMVPQITMKSMELHGGYGTTLDYPIQRLHRDAVSAVVAGGAPAVLRNSIASMRFPDLRFPQTRG